jgi:alpha-methylacyl-CoA racemase
LPDTVVYCSLTGFGSGVHAARAGHDLNYLGYAGVLADTAPGLPPVQIADLGAGALTAVAEILAALLERERTGRGSVLEISMTHGAHRFAAHRLAGEPVPRLLTGGLACYRIYETADGRYLTVSALEPKFFRRLCELLERTDLDSLHFDPAAQERLGGELAGIFASKPLAAWLELFEGEDVAVGPVATLEEAGRDFAYEPPTDRAPVLGEHTGAWRAELRP